VEGDIVAPRVAIADGSHFRGSIDMQRTEPPVPKDGSAPDLDARATLSAAASVTGEFIRV
jgi:hypothetical protein